MHAAIDRLLDERGGACSRAELLTVVSEAELGNEVRRRRLERIFPRAYARPWMADQPDVRDRAAIASVGAPVAISHTSALRRWGAPTDDDQVHVTTLIGRRFERTPGLIIHVTSQHLTCSRDRGVLTAAPEYAVVQTWTISGERRAMVLEAVRRGLATPSTIARVVEASKRLPARRELTELLTLLDGGCESELEIWGQLQVFDVPGLRHGVQQYEIRAGGRTYRLDRAYVEERVAVELDGEAYHSSRQQRERDRRRDAALATRGWLTVRFSYRRLTSDPDGCRRELLAILAARAPNR